MKRMCVILFILAFILCVAAGGVFYAKYTCEQMVAMTEEAEQLSEERDVEALLSQAKKMSAFLESRHLILSLYVRHDELEKLTTHLLDLYAQAEAGDAEVHTVLVQIAFMARHIYERELPNLDNLL